MDRSRLRLHEFGVRVFLLSLLLWPATGAAQTGLATITGLVSDQSGGAVPGVTVTANNRETNVNYTGLSNEAGNYVITGLPVGSYTVSVELSGFKGVRSRLALSAAQTARLDFKLEVGGLQEVVDVVATGAIMQTQNATVGTQVPREELEKSPLIGRNVSSVTMFTAG